MQHITFRIGQKFAINNGKIIFTITDIIPNYYPFGESCIVTHDGVSEYRDAEGGARAFWEDEKAVWIPEVGDRYELAIPGYSVKIENKVIAIDDEFMTVRTKKVVINGSVFAGTHTNRRFMFNDLFRAGRITPIIEKPKKEKTSSDTVITVDDNTFEDITKPDPNF